MDKRRFIDAVIQTVDKIRSSLLLKILTGFVEKLLRAIGGIRGLIGNFAFEMQNFGYPLAQRVSVIAVKWGNNLAANWSNDEGFIRYLTVIDMNNLSIFKVSNKTMNTKSSSDSARHPLNVNICKFAKSRCERVER